MECLILAGGFGKRLGGISSKIPKPLLSIYNKHIIEHIIDNVLLDNRVSKITISTNKFFYNKFKDFLDKKYKNKFKISIFVEPTTSEKTKLGSMGAVYHFIKKINLQDDLLIICGDNLFGFKIKNFLDYYYRYKKNIIAIKDIKNLEKAKNFGVISLDNNGKIINLDEKPINPVSTVVSTGCYILKRDYFPLLEEYLRSGFNKDSIGSFMSLLIKQTNVISYKSDDYWFDIGTIETLKDAQQYFKSNRKE